MRVLTEKEAKVKACDACAESVGGRGRAELLCPFPECPYDDFDQSVHYKLSIERKQYEI